MSERPVVGVRYCGGCNPRYDRVAAVRELQRRFPEAVFAPGEPGHSLVLVACGCSARCADVSDLHGRLLWLCAPGDGERAAGQLARRL